MSTAPLRRSVFFPRRARRAAALAVTGALLLAGATPASSAEDSARRGWVGSWATSATVASGSGPSATGFTDTTIRQVVRLSVGGSQIRLRLTNAFGSKALDIGAATVGRQTPGGGPNVADGTLRQVRFGGERSTSIPPGAEWVSDPIDLEVADGENLAVSLYLPGPTGPVTQHPFAMATSWSVAGDDSAGDGPGFTPLHESWFLLDGVDVETVNTGSVVFFGDSITDGVASTVDGNKRYPDQVAARMLAKPESSEFGVLNAGIAGARLLTDQGDYGQNAMARFDRDVSGQTGARAVVLLLGINDIGGTKGAVTPEELISVHRQFIARAKGLGLRVLGATIMPMGGSFYDSPEAEADRQALNKFIRTSGAYDGVIDFDRATADPAQPHRLLAAYDAGDGLHPNDAGMAAMAAAVPIDRLIR